MNQNKLDRLETIRKYLENDDFEGVNRFLDRIREEVKKDEDFQDIMAEVKDKNYEQALFLTEDIIYEIKESDFTGDFEDLEVDSYDDKDEFGIDEDGDFGDLDMDGYNDLDLDSGLEDDDDDGYY